MDRWALAMGNYLVGNPGNAAALEWAVGGGSLRFDHGATIALTGADAEAALDGTLVSMNEAISVGAGQELTIRRLTAHRFLYVAVRGGIDCPIVLGSRSTYLPAGFGGIGGRRLIRGDTIPIGTRAAADQGGGPPDGPAPDYNSAVIRVIGATESRLLESFFAGVYAVSLASDRTGYRLEEDTALDSADTSITSEPVCAGTIQLPPGGHPIALMADSPTIGGYRILGTVISIDLPILAQSVPGRRLKFEPVSVDTAQQLLRGR
jgi:antagonist of KipI